MERLWVHSTQTAALFSYDIGAIWVRHAPNSGSSLTTSLTKQPDAAIRLARVVELCIFSGARHRSVAVSVRTGSTPKNVQMRHSRKPSP